MAFTLTNKGSDLRYNVFSELPSFTPTAGKLLILTMLRSNTTVVSIVGHGAWNLIGTRSAGSKRIWMYGLIASSTPTASTIKVTWGSNSTNEISVTEVDGADVSGTFANAIVQFATLDQYNGGGGPFTMTTNLSVFQSPTNLTLLTGMVSGTTLPEAGYSTDFNGTRHVVYYLASEDTTPSYTGTSTFGRVGAIAVEIREEPTGTVLPILQYYYARLRNE